MLPSGRVATASGTVLGTAAGAVAYWVLAAHAVLAGAVALFLGLATTLSLWGLPRLEWSNEGEQTPGVFEFGLIAAVSAVPTLAIAPVFVLDGVAFGTELALVGLVFGVGFTGFGGCASLLAFNHYRYGGDLGFAETGATAE